MVLRALSFPLRVARRLFMSKWITAMLWAHSFMRVVHARKVHAAKKRRLRLEKVGKMGVRDLEKIMSQLPEWMTRSDIEKVDFLNRWIQSSWEGIGSVIEQSLRELIEPLLQEMYVGEDIRFGEIDVGEHPIIIGGVKVHEQHLVVDDQGRPVFSLDIDVLWGANCRAVLIIKQNKYLKFSAQIENVSFRGKIRLSLSPIVPILPIVGGLHISFVEMPHIDYTLALLDTIQVGSIPKLSGWLQALFKRECLYWMCNPFFLSFPFVDEDHGLQSSTSIRQAMGILSVHVVRGQLQYFQSSWRDIPSLSIMLELLNQNAGFTASVQTKGIKSLEPEWGETFHFLVDSAAQALHIALTSEERQKQSSQVEWTSQFGRADLFMKIITPSLTMAESTLDLNEIVANQARGSTGVDREQRSMWVKLSETRDWARADSDEDAHSSKVMKKLVSLAQHPVPNIISATTFATQHALELTDLHADGEELDRQVHLKMSFTPLSPMTGTKLSEGGMTPFGAFFVRFLYVSGFSDVTTGSFHIMATIPGQAVQRTRSSTKKYGKGRVSWNQECRFVLDRSGVQESMFLELRRKPLMRKTLIGNAVVELAPLLDRIRFSRLETIPLSIIEGREKLTLHVGFFWRQAVSSEPVLMTSSEMDNRSTREKGEKHLILSRLQAPHPGPGYRDT